MYFFLPCNEQSFFPKVFRHVASQSIPTHILVDIVLYNVLDSSVIWRLWLCLRGGKVKSTLSQCRDTEMKSSQKVSIIVKKT